VASLKCFNHRIIESLSGFWRRKIRDFPIAENATALINN
jgi:hypothetical protein